MSEQQPPDPKRSKHTGRILPGEVANPNASLFGFKPLENKEDAITVRQEERRSREKQLFEMNKLPNAKERQAEKDWLKLGPDLAERAWKKEEARRQTAISLARKEAARLEAQRTQAIADAERAMREQAGRIEPKPKTSLIEPIKSLLGKIYKKPNT